GLGVGDGGTTECLERRLECGWRRDHAGWDHLCATAVAEFRQFCLGTGARSSGHAGDSVRSVLDDRSLEAVVAVFHWRRDTGGCPASGASYSTYIRKGIQALPTGQQTELTGFW